MPIEVELFQDEPIIILHMSEPVDYEFLARDAAELVTKATAGMDGPIYRISNYNALKPSFTDMLLAISGARQAKKGGLKDERMRPILVSNHELAKIGRIALNQSQYSLGHVQVFTTPEEAVAYAREQIKASKAEAPQA